METDILAIVDDANLAVRGSDELIKGKLNVLRTNQSASLDAFILSWKPNQPVHPTQPNFPFHTEGVPPFPENDLLPPPPPPAYDEIKFTENEFPLPLMTQEEYYSGLHSQGAGSAPFTLSGLSEAPSGMPSIPIDAAAAATTSHTEREEKCMHEGFSVSFAEIGCIKVSKTEYESRVLVKLHSDEVLPPLVFYATKGLAHMLQTLETYMTVTVNGDTYRFAEIEDKLSRSIFISMNSTSQFTFTKSSSDVSDDVIIDGSHKGDDDDDDGHVVIVPGPNSNAAKSTESTESAAENQEGKFSEIGGSMEGFTFVEQSSIHCGSADPSSSSAAAAPPQEGNRQNDAKANTFGKQVAGFFNKKYKYIGKVITEQMAAYEKQWQQAQEERRRQQQLQLQQQQQQDPRQPHRIIEITEENPFAGLKEYAEHELAEFDFLRQCSNKACIAQLPEHDGAPMGVMEYMELFDERGCLVEGGLQRLQRRGFYTGFDENVQSEAWKMLLGFYPLGATADEREKINAERRERYSAIKAYWKGIDGEQKKLCTSFARDLVQIDKDVVRTDREHRIFRDMDKVDELRDILASYVCYNMDLGYVQGMNDLCAIVMDVMMTDEAMTFWSFKCLMERTASAFSRDQIGVKTRLLAISRILRIVDPELYEYLESVHAQEMYFCYRWILVLFKREFDFNETKLLWEPILSNCMVKRFELFVACAMAVYLRSDIMLNSLSFDQILHFVNLFGSEHLFPVHKIVTLADLIYAKFCAEVEINKNEQNISLRNYLRGDAESFASGEEMDEVFEKK